LHREFLSLIVSCDRVQKRLPPGFPRRELVFRAIVLDKHGNIIAGDKTVENAGAIELEDVIVVQTDGTKLVAVQRMDLDLAKGERGKRIRSKWRRSWHANGT
jgi:hypothetical protein